MPSASGTRNATREVVRCYFCSKQRFLDQTKPWTILGGVPVRVCNDKYINDCNTEPPQLEGYYRCVP